MVLQTWVQLQVTTTVDPLNQILNGELDVNPIDSMGELLLDELLALGIGMNFDKK